MRRHHLPADAARLPASRRHHGLAHPQGAGVVHLEHPQSRLLRRCAEQGHPPLRCAGIMNTNQGSQFTYLDGPNNAGRHKELNGWHGTVYRRYLHQALLVVPQVRMRLPAPMGTGSQAKAASGDWIIFYNHRAPPMAGIRPPWSTSTPSKSISRRIQ